MKPIDTQTMLITGATDGIGKLTALELARQKAHVLVHGRNQTKVTALVEELKEITGNPKIEGVRADFSALSEVRRLADEVLEKYSGLDLLINNAGVGFAGEQYSRDGFELRLAVNYLAPFTLTRRLLPALKTAAPARIVNVASAGQHPIDFADIMLEQHFDGTRAYRQSKSALIMFTFDLAAELRAARISVNCLHPGTFLNTNMVREAGITPMGEPQSGADAVVFLATSPTLEDISGRYFDVTQESRALPQAYDPEARKQLRELTLQLTGKEKKDALLF